MFFFWKLYTLSFMFRSVFHPRLISLYGVKKGLKFIIFFICVFHYYLLKRFAFPIELPWHLCRKKKSSDEYVWVCAWTLFCTIGWSTFIPILFCHGYCSFTGNLEIR